ncbi:GCN5 family N-acetyltransferase [Thalassobaculum fulvum]|jgi:phosphinothricin acetyltransferase|uniref:GCN5 family N-acetyltransferase n=1 Tax=Thalassobaculum fulvum TaxID=1633335 RepID=A0A918XQY9_9PROT|nr:GNAT family N-acetyltransferase [Thalassobaculum fulvum]GHD45850.1 GCN5 family N-acetyltransferase [Thalassobaculum fulvum]
MSDPSILVRPSTPDDLPAIQAIYAHHVTHGFGSFEEVPPDVQEMAARRLAIVERGLPHLVAEADGRVLGYAYAGPYRPRPAYRYTVENSVYVAPEAVRHGVGRALLTALIEICEAGPWRQMIAVIGDRGNTASIALHAALGFHEAGHLKAVGFKLGRWVDVVIMQRALGAGDDVDPD